MMKKFNFALFSIFVAVVVLSCSNFAFAQQGIPAEKKALILEVRDLTGMTNLTAKTGFTSTTVGKALNNVVNSDKDLTGGQKQELQKSITEGTERLENQIREFSEDKAISEQTFEEAFVGLYDKNFTEAELRELVVFYRTPTGKKAAAFMNKFNDQIMKAFSDAFGKKLQDFASSKLEAEVELLKQKIKEMKNKKLET
jgi:hypothetical protein